MNKTKWLLEFLKLTILWKGFPICFLPCPTHPKITPASLLMRVAVMETSTWENKNMFLSKKPSLWSSTACNSPPRILSESRHWLQGSNSCYWPAWWVLFPARCKFDRTVFCIIEFWDAAYEHYESDKMMLTKKNNSQNRLNKPHKII